MCALCNEKPEQAKELPDLMLRGITQSFHDMQSRQKLDRRRPTITCDKSLVSMTKSLPIVITIIKSAMCIAISAKASIATSGQ